MKKANGSIGARSLTEAEALRLGRTLRRFSRTSREMMRMLDLKDDEVKIPRKKKRPARKPQAAEIAEIS